MSCEIFESASLDSLFLALGDCRTTTYKIQIAIWAKLPYPRWVEKSLELLLGIDRGTTAAQVEQISSLIEQ